MKLDLSFTITAIIALAALISPMITTIINNKHQILLKDAELKLSERKDFIIYKRSIYENFLKTAGQFFGEQSQKNLGDFRNSYFAIIPYLTEDLRGEMELIDHEIDEGEFDNASLHFRQRIISAISNDIENLTV